jgi:hypothetical protein
MPDIQTALKSALSKTLQQWDDDDEGTAVPVPSVAKQPVSLSFSPTSNQKPIMAKHLYNITNNVSRETFNYIKQNPGSKRMEIITALEHRGFGKASVSSLIAQMRRCKMVHDTDGLWYADVDEYTPIKNYVYAKKKAKAKPAKKGTTGIGALLREKLENTPMPSQDAMDAAAYAMTGIAVAPKRMVTLVRSQEPDEIIENLTVFQARDLYDRLKQIFGG